MRVQNDKVDRTGLEIAVIGMSGRFPGSDSINEFWENIKNGVESISNYSDDELRKGNVEESLINNNKYVRAKGRLRDKECFDYNFFNYSKRDAELLDPQIRLLLECAWNALEDSGYDSLKYKGNIGLYAGASPNLHWQIATMLDGELKDVSEKFLITQLSNKDFMATMLAHKLNLKGPAVCLQTACSTSLGAIHLASRSLLTGECKIALAGGVCVTFPENKGYLHEDGMILSQDGHCRAFDEDANGTVSGEGVGVVALKLLKNAIADKDNIYCVIKGSAMNNDGNRKVGYSAPSITGQAEVIKTAHMFSKVNSESITYIEAHGTGTNVGDPIELEALKQAFNTNKTGYCAIGSVKPNIGHLDTAAGIAGFIKTVMALKDKKLPPSINYKTPNSKFDYQNSPFFVNTSLKNWSNEGGLLRAGVSSFGIGGTNVHIVLEEYNENLEFEENSDNNNIIILSAKSQEALDKQTTNLREFVVNNPKINVSDLAYTLQTGRHEFEFRRALVCADRKELIDNLSSGIDEDGIISKRIKYKTCKITNGKNNVIFMFSGQGAQYVNMGVELYKNNSFFRGEMDKCFNIVNSKIGINLKDIVFNLTPDNEELINETHITQPLLLSLEYSLSKLLIHLGINPAAFIGYSFGECVAACISGVFSLEDAIEMSIVRGRLMEDTPKGIMLSVSLTKRELIPIIDETVSIAVDNEESCIISGTEKDILAFESKMKERKLLCMRINSTQAAHSHLMDGMLDDYSKKISNIKLNKPSIPFISCNTGTWISDEEATSLEYWTKHIRNTVNFAAGIRVLRGLSNPVFIEVGPGRDLATLISRFVSENDVKNIIDIIPAKQKNINSDEYIYSKIALLWTKGIEIKWKNLNKNGRRISIPVYPFKKIQLGLKYFNELNSTLNEKLQFNSVKQNESLCYIPSWVRNPLINIEGCKTKNKRWIIFKDNDCKNEILTKKITERYEDVIIIEKSDIFKDSIDEKFNEVFEKRLETVLKKEYFNEDINILFLWSINNDGTVNNILNSGFFSLISISKLIGEYVVENEVKIYIVSANMYDVYGGEIINPVKGVIIGAMNIIPKEYLNIKIKNIDILEDKFFDDKYKISENIINEIKDDDSESVVAYRGFYRMTRKFNPINIEGSKNESLSNKIRNDGTYMITGGAGGIGLVLAEWMCNEFNAKVALVGRTQIPERDEWDSWLLKNDDKNNIYNIITNIKLLEDKGFNIIYICADVGNKEIMVNVINKIENTFGEINGIIHAAGVKDGSFIQRRSFEDSYKVLYPKINGTMVINSIVKNKNLDFVVLCSSLASIKDTFGQVAYSAANAFLDTFAYYANGEANVKTYSINWDRWKGIGIGKTIENTYKEFTGSEMTGGISREEGTKILKYILNLNFPQVAVSTLELESFIEHDTSYEEEFEKINLGIGREVERADLSNEYEAPCNKVEEILVSIWEEFFKITPIGINDDFVELGGDSLKAIILSSKIEKELSVKVPLIEFFNALTIKNIAGIVGILKDLSVIKQNENYKDMAAHKKYKSCSIEDEKIDELLLNEKDVEDVFDLSPMQEEVLSHNILNYKSKLNVSLFSFMFEGKLEIEIFKKSWDILVNRHQVLRSSFRWKRLKNPIQIIYKNIKHDITEVDLTNINSKEQEKYIEQINESEKCKAYKVIDKKLIRITILILSPSKARAILTYMNSLFDGWSTALIFKELMLIYKSLYLNEDIILPEPTNLSHYIRWVSDKDYTSAKKIWQNEFKDFIISKNIEGINNTYIIPDEYEFYLTEENNEKLLKYANNNGVTLNSIMQGIWILFLGYYHNEKDILSATVTSGRTAAIKNIENTVGLFTNILPIRSKINYDMLISEWFKMIKTKLMILTENEYVSTNQIQEWCNISDKEIERAVYERTLVCANYPVEEDNGMNDKIINLEEIKMETHINVPLRVYSHVGDKTKITVHYDTNKYNLENVKKYIEIFNKMFFDICDKDVTIKEFYGNLSEYINN